MAVEAPDKEERENPVRNFVSGTNGDHKIKWVRAVDPDGKEHRINSDNTSDWQARGPGWRVVGAWSDAEAQESDEVDEDEDEDEDKDTDPATTPPAANTQPSGDAGVNHLENLHKLRAEAEALGVTVNDQWGTRRLNQEIASAKFRQKQSGV